LHEPKKGRAIREKGQRKAVEKDAKERKRQKTYAIETFLKNGGRGSARWIRVNKELLKDAAIGGMVELSSKNRPGKKRCAAEGLETRRNHTGQKVTATEGERLNRHAHQIKGR